MKKFTKLQMKILASFLCMIIIISKPAFFAAAEVAASALTENQNVVSSDYLVASGANAQEEPEIQIATGPNAVDPEASNPAPQLPCEECKLIGEHDETCSQYVAVCTCGSEDDVHEMGCPCYVAVDVFALLMDAETVEEMREALLAALDEYFEEALELTEKEIAKLMKHAASLPAETEDELAWQEEILEALSYLPNGGAAWDGMMAYSAVDNSAVYIGEIQLESGYYTGSSGELKWSMEKPDGGWAHYDEDSRTVTLHDLTYSGGGKYLGTNGSDRYAGVLGTQGTLNVVVEGENSLTYSDLPDGKNSITFISGIASYSLKAEKDGLHLITISGDGILNLYTKVYQSKSSSSTAGIVGEDGVIIDGNVTINVKVGDAMRYSHGIHSHGPVAIKDATLDLIVGNVTSSGASGYSHSIGIISQGGTVETALTIEGAAQISIVAGTAAKNHTKIGASGSFGLYASKGITISDYAHLDIVTQPSIGGSFAIYASDIGGDANVALTISDYATLTAQSGEKMPTQTKPSGAMYGGIIDNQTVEAKLFAGNDSDSAVRYADANDTQENKDHYPNAEVTTYTGNYFVAIEPADHPIWVEGIRINRDNRGDVLGERDGEAATVVYDHINNVLILNGFHYRNESGYFHKDNGISAGLYADCDLTIRLDNDNTVENSDTKTDRSAAVYVSGAATFIGSGSLTATGNTSLHSYGIYCDNATAPITFSENVKITAKAATSSKSGDAICSAHSAIIIKDNTNITAIGGRAESKASNGIYAYKDITISDNAMVNATGGTAKGTSHGIMADHGSVYITTEGTVKATGETTTGGAYTVEEGASHSRGIFAREWVEISNGIVYAEAGESSQSKQDGRNAGSHAIDGQQSGIKISGDAKVTAIGGTAAGNSVGLYTAGTEAGEKGEIYILNDAVVEARSANVNEKWSNGIQAKTKLVIQTTGSVTAVGGDNAGGTHGINAEAIEIIDSPNVVVKSGNCTENVSRALIGSTVTITNSTVTATAGRAGYKGNNIYYADGINGGGKLTINNSTIEASVDHSGVTSECHAAGIRASNVEVIDSVIDVEGDADSKGNSYGILAKGGTVTINNSMVRAFVGADKDEAYSGNGIESNALVGTDAMILTTSQVASNETWDNSVLYIDPNCDTQYDGELRDNTGAMVVTPDIEPDMDAMDTLTVQDGETLVLSSAFTKSGNIYVNWCGVLQDNDYDRSNHAYSVPDTYAIYFELVNGIGDTVEIETTNPYEKHSVDKFREKNYLPSSRNVNVLETTVTVKPLDIRKYLSLTAANNEAVGNDGKIIAFGSGSGSGVTGTTELAGYEIAKTFIMPESPVKLTGTMEYMQFTINNQGSSDLDPGQRFIYRISGTAADSTTKVDMYVSIEGNGQKTILGLPHGTYDVTLQDDWSWRYDVKPEEGKVQSVSIKAVNSGTLYYVNDRTNSLWQDDNHGVDNDFAAPSTSTAGMAAIVKRKKVFAA